MLRLILLIHALVLCVASTAAAQTTALRYALVRMAPVTDAQHRVVDALELDHAISSPQGVTAALSTAELEQVRAAGVPHTVVIGDLEQHYAARSARDLAEIEKHNPGLLARPSAQVEGFRLGSHAGYLTTLELHAQLTEMHQRYPGFAAEPEVIGRTHQGRDLVAIRISALPLDDSSAPRALFTAMHHAREGGGMMSLMYTMWALLEGYGRDAEITWLLDNRVLYFIPLINPDGWEYNIRRSPAGGGLWRRNMRADGDSAVDLNRNYGPMEYWNHAIGGSSTNRLSDTYRGPAPFSEPETRAIRDFVTRVGFNVALNHHTFSNLLIQSDAIVTMTGADSAYFRVATPAIANAVGYAPGGDRIAVGYSARGTSDDWMFSFGRSDGRRVYAWTPESGNEEDGFWPVRARITPIAEGNHRMNLRIAWTAGAAPTVTHTTWTPGSPVPEVIVTIANIGRETMDTVAAISIVGVDEETVVPVLQPSEKLQFSLPVPAGLPGGTEPRAPVVVRTRYHGAVLYDTIRPIVHPVVTLIDDSFDEGFGGWTSSGGWGIERVPGRGDVASDSPGGPYRIDEVPNALTTTVPVSLDGYDAAELQFDAFFAVEARSHDARVEARFAGELEWFPVDAVDLMLPVQNIATYRNHFRGEGRVWRSYTARLDDYVGQDIEVRFVVESGPSQFGYTFDGLQIDNVRLLASPTIINAADDGVAEDVRRAIATPNPFSDRVTVQVAGARGRITVTLIDPLGAVVTSGEGTGRVALDTRGLPAGAYTAVATADGAMIRTRVVLVR